MKNVNNSRAGVLLASGLILGLLLTGICQWASGSFGSEAQAQENPPPKAVDVRPRQIDPEVLEERLPDQSHAMQDAAYHFENLWFAGTNQNWPLASYYLRKTRSYLQLAVLIKPERKTEEGAVVDLKAFLDAIDHGLLTQDQKAIENKDVAGFQNAYRQTIEGCNACHTACERSYVRLQVPNAPSTAIIKFDPAVPSPN